MSSLKIPESEHANLSHLLRASPDVLDAVYAALKGSPPKPRREDLADYLAEKLAGKADAATLSAAARTLTALYWLRASEELEPADLASEFVQAASQEDSGLPVPQQGWDAFKAQLTRLMSLDESLGLAGKATFLAYQGQRHLHSARVLTDARPVFANDPTVPPAAFVIIHTLQLEYHQAGEDKEWFICMDDDDLESLKQAVDRAVIKRQSLTEMLKRAEAPILAWSVTDAN